MVLEISEHEIMIDVGEGRPIEHVNVDPFVCEDRDFIDAVQGKENRIRAPYAEALRTHKLVTQATQIARQHENYQEANQREAAHV